MMEKSLTFENLLNGSLENFSLGVSVSGSISSAMTPQGSTSESSDITKSKNFQPGLYYNELRNYPFLKTIVNILKAPLEEAIDQIQGQIKIDLVKTDGLPAYYKDAVIIVNNFFEKCNFKDYLKRHLDEMILRGSYISYIDYKGGKLLDVIDPYNFEMIYNGEEISWIIPKENKDIASLPSQLNINSLVNQLGDFYGAGGEIKGLRGNQFIKYYYDIETIAREPRKTLTDSKNMGKKFSELITILGKDLKLNTAQKLTEEEKQRIDDILLMYSVYRPKSIFEPHLKSLFTLSIKEMVFEILSLLQYLKADYFTVAVKPHSPDRKRPLSIVQDVSAALNKYNLEFIKTFEDPSGIIRAVYDKLLNRNEVLPVLDEFSDISILNIPDMDQRLATLFQDIVETKRAKADEIGVSQESISGNSNRWEAISRNEKMVLNEMGLKNTIEKFVKQAACDIFYNHVNETYWSKENLGEAYPTTFNFSNRNHELDPNGINKQLENYSKEDGISRVGIKLNPDNFKFDLNLSTILDSYASKTKETIIAESLQATSMVLDNIKNLFSHLDVIDSNKLVSYLDNLLGIGDHTSGLIDKEKLKELIEAQQNQSPADPMMDQPVDENGNPIEGVPEEPMYY